MPFPPCAQEMSRAEITSKMAHLAATLDGLKRSIEYLQVRVKPLLL